MTKTAQTDKATDALKALDDAWAYFTPLPKAVETAKQDAAQPVYAPYSHAA